LSFNDRLGPEDVGVISPYSAQNKKLRQLETVRRCAGELKTGTVEAFQAQVSQSLLATCEELISTYDAGATNNNNVYSEELARPDKF
jgi:hypothetical protein